MRCQTHSPTAHPSGLEAGQAAAQAGDCSQGAGFRSRRILPELCGPGCQANSLRHGFLICKVSTMILFTSQGCCKE